MGCTDNSEKFFTALKEEKSAHYELCQRNKVFSKLGRDFRYSGLHEQGVKRKRDADEDVRTGSAGLVPSGEVANGS